MSALVAVLSSDPNLMRCVLRRLREDLAPQRAAGWNSVGLGAFCDEELLLQRFGPDGVKPPLDELWAGTSADALLLHAQKLPLGLSLEENTQPFRYRHWLFALEGSPSFGAARSRLMALLPEFLQRQIRGDTDSELAFAVFLKLLRDTGRTDQVQLEPAEIAELLAKTVRAIDGLAREAGSTQRMGLNLLTSNGRMLLATRAGGPPLYFRLLESLDGCAQCGIAPGASELDPRVRAHRRLKAMVIASSQARGPGEWSELADDSTLTVDRHFRVLTLPA